MTSPIKSFKEGQLKTMKRREDNVVTITSIEGQSLKKLTLNFLNSILQL